MYTLLQSSDLYQLEFDFLIMGKVEFISAGGSVKERITKAMILQDDPANVSNYFLYFSSFFLLFSFFKATWKQRK